MKQTLQIHCEVENITKIEASSDMVYPIRLKCTQCREEYANLITVDPNERYSAQNSRSDANVVIHCKFCKKDGKIDVLEALVYQVDEPENGEITFDFAIFEVRGVEIIGYEPCAPFLVNNIEADVDDDWVEVLDSGICLSLMNLSGSIK
eukprot:NODE_183_length_13752_cov_1.079103.p9 type:complete len:149 gc:universal NODE_183_length_13752_cov_1.079103:5470-5024(-)